MIKNPLHPPRTAVEVFKMLPEGVNCQVIENVLYMSPAPSFNHQDVVSEILTQIRLATNKSKTGKCVASPIDVFLDDENAYQPDIVFISSARLSIIKEDGKIYGVPELIVEVLSKGNQDHDLVKKKAVYERCGVKEYFIVEPSSKQVITYYLKRKKFEEQKAVNAKIVSALLKKTFKF
ncbi:Uma2 family endonuclease [Terrimonas pollutisoli]|uniref:Uma2 family endonuclease n=1 Tax=Terrimonas pollutisoli TaxID=3034147 RepID=UPI0023ECCF7A|nr:Uma2 family endonuclease [Terrimonas sp. H1YJ31]